MVYFTTLFDSLYLSRGLIMHKSLYRNCPEFHLYIFTFDELSFTVLNTIRPESTTIIPLHEFESAELLEVKQSRTRAEYCWTCTPSVISYVLTKFKVPNCTYVDADLQFFSDPTVLINEMISNNRTVLITEHRYSLIPRLYELKRGGRFCVQFMTFLNEENSLRVLNDWRVQCLDWCFAKYEDGKFGDQKYLDTWPEKYSNIHILEHQGGGVAPWNLGNYSFTVRGSGIRGKTKSKNKFKVVFYHFQYVKFISSRTFDLGWYYISNEIRKIFYDQYLNQVISNERMLSQLDLGYNTNFTLFRTDTFRNILKTFFKKTTRYNLLTVK